MNSIFEIALMLIDLIRWVILAHIVMSWLISFQVLNLRQPLVSSLWNALNGSLEPMYARVRAMLPQLGGVDLAPLVLLLGVHALRIVLINNAAYFF